MGTSVHQSTINSQAVAWRALPTRRSYTTKKEVTVRTAIVMLGLMTMTVKSQSQISFPLTVRKNTRLTRQIKALACWRVATKESGAP